MKAFSYIVILLFATMFITHDALSSELTFECGFIQEKLPQGKSNKASCSMDPDKVYSTSGHQHDKNDHCDIEPVSHYEDYLNFLVTDAFVSWKAQEGLTEAFKPRMKKYYIEHGESQEKAEELVNSTDSIDYSFSVFSHYVGQSDIRINSLTNEPYEKPKKQKIHVYTFGNKRQSFSLYIPEISKKVILIQYSSSEDSSWVGIRFGRCRVRSNNP